MRKIYSLVLIAVGLLISTNSWANYIMPEIEAKPVAPEINEVLNTPRRAPQGDAVVVAKVGDVEYTSLQEALKASSEATPAVVQEACSSVGITLSSGNAYLDLNGKVIDFAAQYITLNGTAILTIVDNSAEHTGQIKSSQKWGAFDIYKGATLNLLGGWVNCSNQYGIYQNGGSSSEIGGYCTVNIDGEYTKVTAQYFAITTCAYNHLNIKNGYAYGGYYAVVGNGNHHYTEITIDGGTFEAPALCIYHPQNGKLTINGGTFVCENAAVEMRAGELTINGGNFTATDNIKFKPNSSGASTWGAAISAAQHTTKLPVIITINGGIFNAPIALMQVNPQNNSEEDYIKMKVNVFGGNFMSTHTTGGTLYAGDKDYSNVTYADDAMCISQNKRIFLMGGYYNYDPVEFVATGYKCYPITESDYPTEYAAGYRFRIGEINPEDAVQTTTCDNCSDWKNDAAMLWSDSEVPTDETPIVINDKEVVVTTPATAYSVTVGNGTSKLTIKEGGMLMVGAGGINGATKQNFVVEDGGMLCVAPNAEDYQHPEGTVIISSDYARRKNTTADAKEVSDLLGDDLYWRHIACPTINADRKLTLSQTGKTYVNTWNLRNGWESKSATDIKAPFVGYNISTTLASTTRATDTILYTFEGQLAGNTVELLKFANTGFTFFGNSFLAPLDIRELLTSLDVNGDVESSVILYHHENDEYEYVNRATYALPTTTAEIEPLQGFFIFSAEPASVQYDYIKSVWDAFCAKARAIEMGAASAPARQQTTMDNNFDAIACVQLSSIDGKQDKVYLFEGAEYSSALDKGYDARKMNTNGLQIAAVGENDQLAIIATDNLEGTELSLSTTDATQYSLSFSNVSGKALAIYDVITATTINIEEGANYNFTADANATLDGRFRVVSARQTPTDIVENKVTPKKEGIYTILGQYVGKNNIWHSLPKGVYVVNGEKMIR